VKETEGSGQEVGEELEIDAITDKKGRDGMKRGEESTD
jgi:hypothetical protein